jgi:hypothetical protein
MPPSKPVYRKIRSTIPPPKGITSKNNRIYSDRAGNILFARKKVDGTIQWSGKNAENRLLNHTGIMTLMKRWNRRRR